MERIVTLHPEEGKQGTNIDRHKYETIRDAILEATQERGTIAFRDLTDAVRERVGGDFQGSVSWYVTTVKLDLEARGLLERISGRKPQQLQLAGGQD
jgi:hypothetical protein